jgi:hypothetical protein
MQNDEIADLFQLAIGHVVVSVHNRGSNTACCVISFNAAAREKLLVS